jgi:hypothetical protein
MGVLIGGDGYMASSAFSLRDSVMGARILVTAAKSMSGGGSTTSLSSASVFGVGLCFDNSSELEPREVTLLDMVEAILQLFDLLVSATECAKALNACLKYVVSLRELSEVKEMCSARLLATDASDCRRVVGVVGRSVERSVEKKGVRLPNL